MWVPTQESLLRPMGRIFGDLRVISIDLYFAREEKKAQGMEFVMYLR